MFFVYDLATGALYSSGASVAAPEVLAAAGRAAVEVADAEVPADWIWDADVRLPIERPAPAPVRLMRADELIGRFTPQEWAAGKASQHPGIVWFMDQIMASAGREIDVGSDRVAAGLALAVSEGILDAGRPAEIIA